MNRKYVLYYEDNQAYYFRTGISTGGLMPSEERICLCKQCGMEYAPFQRHGPIDLENCYPRGIGSTNDGEVCTECGRRVDKALTLMHNDIEYVAICPECLEAHHGLDFFTMKYKLLLLVLQSRRNKE